MEKSQLPTQAQIKEILHYDHETGVFRWRHESRNKIKPWDVAGTVTDGGYWAIKIKGKTYKAHRIAWLYMTNEWPKNLIDHIDGNPGNNKWINIRSATVKQNLENQALRKDNKSGFRGVSWHKKTQKWSAKLSHNNKNIWLGSYETPEVAASVVILKRAELFTHDHGRDRGAA
jgi:hypothetical protein